MHIWETGGKWEGCTEQLLEQRTWQQRPARSIRVEEGAEEENAGCSFEVSAVGGGNLTGEDKGAG